MLQTDIDKQHVLQDFVNREVIYCVSSLVYGLSQQSDAGLFDDFPELFEGAPSYGNYTCPDCKHEWEAEPDQLVCAGEGCYTSLQDDIDFEPTEYQEILEHWIVSDWLADKLAEHGEAVCKDFYGLTVWGRTTSGEGIALDGVIESIYDELHK